MTNRDALRWTFFLAVGALGGTATGPLLPWAILAAVVTALVVGELYPSTERLRLKAKRERLVAEGVVLDAHIKALRERQAVLEAKTQALAEIEFELQRLGEPEEGRERKETEH